jgi:polyferredoxin
MSIMAYSMYPFLGGRTWCRFFCPAGRLFRWIGDNGNTVIAGKKENCIECGKCTRACEMGIDVREFIQSSQAIPQGICVGCGICIAACPRENLHFAKK